jgi:hypothetical protein
MAMPSRISPLMAPGRYLRFWHADVRVERDHHAVRPQPRHLLHDDGVVEEIGAGAAVLGGRVGAEKTFGAGAAPGFAVTHAARVPLLDPGNDLLFGEAPELLAEQLVVGAEDVTSHCVLLEWPAKSARGRERWAIVVRKALQIQ